MRRSCRAFVLTVVSNLHKAGGANILTLVKKKKERTLSANYKEFIISCHFFSLCRRQRVYGVTLTPYVVSTYSEAVFSKIDMDHKM